MLSRASPVYGDCRGRARINEGPTPALCNDGIIMGSFALRLEVSRIIVRGGKNSPSAI